MAKATSKGKAKKKKLAEPAPQQVSELGRTLRRIREEYIAAGGKLCTLDEINDEIAEGRRRRD